MLKNFTFRFFIVTNLWILICKASLPEDIANSSDECLSNSLEVSVLCRGSRAIRNAFNNLSKTNKPVVIVRGLELVPSKSQPQQQQQQQQNQPNSLNSTATSGNGMLNTTNESGDNIDMDDDSFLGRFSRYLRTHELNIKFSDLMTDESERHDLARDLDQSGMQMNNHLNVNEGRKKDKGGAMMMMALMFSKMMAVMGLGGLGALAMKALGVSMMALMMTAMVGMKSFASQGHESTHSVQYVTADGHHHKRRRRRSSGNNRNSYISSDSLKSKETLQLPLAYKGWRKINDELDKLKSL
ncbi:osiris 5 [Haematobia irritans]|uniref:osiris 5 n=1 Tax=Haematobia irritans TaxID=7368 RepID=UPI003F4FB700